MSQESKNRLSEIGSVFCPHKPRIKSGKSNWKHEQWMRGFTGMLYLGYPNAAYYTQYLLGKMAFKALTKRKI